MHYLRKISPQFAITTLVSLCSTQQRVCGTSNQDSQLNTEVTFTTTSLSTRLPTQLCECCVVLVHTSQNICQVAVFFPTYFKCTIKLISLQPTKLFLSSHLHRTLTFTQSAWASLSPSLSCESPSLLPLGLWPDTSFHFPQ